MSVEQKEYCKVGENWLITEEHHINGVTPEMIAWWWNHIDSTERYNMWHPKDHLRFEWILSPQEKGGHVGAIHRVTESFGPLEPVTLDIRWEDPAEALQDLEYDHAVVGTGTGMASMLNGRFVHQCRKVPGGTHMRSRFWLSSHAPEVVIAALGKHNREEMLNFSTFLPWLYRLEVELPMGKGYFELGEQRIVRVPIFDSAGNECYQYRLTNWELQGYQLAARDPSALVAEAQLTITDWMWHVGEEPVAASL